MDSNNGGDTRRPVTATRTGPNANFGLMPIASTRASRSADWIASAVNSGRSATAAEAARTTCRPCSFNIFCASSGSTAKSSAANRNPSIPGACPNVSIRSWTSGVAWMSSSRCSVVMVCPSTPSRCRNGSIRSARSSTARVRIQSPLMAVHFLMSNRAGLGLTRETSNASAISCKEKNSRSSPIDQPSSAR